MKFKAKNGNTIELNDKNLLNLVERFKLEPATKEDKAEYEKMKKK